MIDLNLIRRTAVVAMFSDDSLAERIVLKGGNALSIVHGIGRRTSIDLDFSIDGDFGDLSDTEHRLVRSLRDRFDTIGLRTFDERLTPRPRQSGDNADPRWGGYVLEFKLIAKDSWTPDKLALDHVRRTSLVIGPDHARKFTIDFSKHEYCGAKEPRDLDEFRIYVYTPSAIVAEKLRAICQQIPEYPLVLHPRPRSRDFYDITVTCEELRLDLADPGFRELISLVFEAKRVPHKLLPRVAEFREFHRTDWEGVIETMAGRVEEFDYYFDGVVQRIELLEPLWNE